MQNAKLACSLTGPDNRTRGGEPAFEKLGAKMKTPVIPKMVSSAPPAAPKHLEKPEAELWTALVEENDFPDVGSLAVLRTALEAHSRARRCREAIDKEGEAVKDRFDQLKPHPLLAAERDARAAFLSAMRMLSLDLAGVA